MTANDLNSAYQAVLKHVRENSRAQMNLVKVTNELQRFREERIQELSEKYDAVRSDELAKFNAAKSTVRRASEIVQEISIYEPRDIKVQDVVSSTTRPETAFNEALAKASRALQMIEQRYHDLKEVWEEQRRRRRNRRAVLITVFSCVVAGLIVLGLLTHRNNELRWQVGLTNTAVFIANATIAQQNYEAKMRATLRESSYRTGTANAVATSAVIIAQRTNNAEATATHEQAVVLTATTEALVAVHTTQTAVANALPATQTVIAIVQIASTPISSNDGWLPSERDFDGVTMVLVPAGCFLMGDNGAGGHQCFDHPFYIDKYEVSREQFTRFGGRQELSPHYSGSDRPINRISWFESRNFCALRDARLPTEAEWEYAARGPDSLLYPWGNTWNINNVVYNRTTTQGTANVGTIPAGSSWVGAMDMSGNVREWTNSVYRDYPYDASDGREADRVGSNRSLRVLRGGSWFGVNWEYLSAVDRRTQNPDIASRNDGFRCVRSFE